MQLVWSWKRLEFPSDFDPRAYIWSSLLSTMYSETEPIISEGLEKMGQIVRLYFEVKEYNGISLEVSLFL